MDYLNVKLSGLSGHPHPAHRNICTTQDVRTLRLHLKFLTRDYPHAEQLAQDQPHLSPACRLCLAPVESTEHVLVSCSATAECRQRIFPELMNMVASVQPMSHILVTPTSAELVQFLLDCTSLNLSDQIRVPAHNPGISGIFKLSRDWCYALNNERKRQLRKLQLTNCNSVNS